MLSISPSELARVLSGTALTGLSEITNGEGTMKDATNPEDGACKFDTGKPRPALIPPEAILEIAKVMAHGAEKYNDNNWRNTTNPMRWTRALDAAMRHQAAWLEGETHDPETGINHLAHAACNMCFLIYFAAHEEYEGADDRW